MIEVKVYVHHSKSLKLIGRNSIYLLELSEWGPSQETSRSNHSLQYRQLESEVCDD